MVAGRQHLDVGRTKARRDQVAVAHKLKRIGHSQKRSEGQASDTVCFFEFSFFEQADFDGVLRRHCFTSPSSRFAVWSGQPADGKWTQPSLERSSAKGNSWITTSSTIWGARP